MSPTPPASPARFAGPRSRRAGWGVGLAGLTMLACAGCLADQGAGAVSANRTAVTSNGARGSTDRDAAAAGRTGDGSGLPNQGTTTGASTGASTTPSQAAELFTACMRANGQPGFPGITITANGAIELDSGGAAVDPFSSAYRTAFDACDHYLPKNADPTPDPAPPSRPLPSLPAIALPAPPTLSLISPSAPAPLPSQPPATSTPAPAPPKPSPSPPPSPAALT
jgi:hypothetical protein